jgi:tmRNA-binding protein
MDVAALDPHGQAIPDLHNGEIQLFDKNNPQPISIGISTARVEKGRIKCELALAKGKRLHDTERKRTAEDEARVEMRRWA